MRRKRCGKQENTIKGFETQRDGLYHQSGKKKTIMGRRIVGIISALSVLVFMQIFVHRSEAFEVSVFEKSYNVRLCYKSNTIKGRYFQPESDNGKPLLVLVHGATYGKWMWDVPGYSWADFFVAQLGYPVLVIDRLGYGDSSHPNGDILTPRGQVHSLKQFLCQVRQEDSERQIIWIGHSMGALLGNMIAGESYLIDGLITIGWIHAQKTQVGPPLFEILKGDYVTWTDEERTTAFYYLEGAAQEIVDYDNSQACSMPRGSILSFLNPDRFVISLIDIPVLLVDGEYDALWVDIDLEAEAALFKNASVTTYLQSDAGHTCMLHLTYQSLFDVIDNWMEQNF